MRKYLTYYWVSTQKQGQSNLEMEAQRRTIEQFCREREILTESTDIESGKNSACPELIKAIAYAKKHQALLVITKLDCLSRNVFCTTSQS